MLLAFSKSNDCPCFVKIAIFSHEKTLKCFRFRVFSFFWLLSLIIVFYIPHFLLFSQQKPGHNMTGLSVISLNSYYIPAYVRRNPFMLCRFFREISRPHSVFIFQNRIFTKQHCHHLIGQSLMLQDFVQGFFHRISPPFYVCACVSHVM